MNLQSPRSRSDLFWSFTWMALQGFGGVLTVAQRVLVERKAWMTREQFVEDWAVAQILPGPNVVNLALMVGGRYFGLSGALSALAGMMALPLLLVLGLAIVLGSVADQTLVQGTLRGLGAVTAGLITATGLKLTAALRSNVMGPLACWSMVLVTFVAVAWLRVPLAWLLLGLGSAATLWAWRCLGQLPPPTAADSGTDSTRKD